MSSLARATMSLCAAAILMQACAAPIQRQNMSPPRPSGLADMTRAVQGTAGGRPLVGVALGGGSARGIAHVGFIRWCEEHRIPIDVVAGTSMGGLIGGAYATGMGSDELEKMLTDVDWDELFGSSTFAFKNIRRKADARDYPSRLEFGLRGGIVPPTALDPGQQVERLLGDIAGSYYDITSFDQLPTPFRAVAVDLLTASEVILDRGSLAEAMRATMSLPLIFPPVEMNGRVLVDGGAMNNVPANVVRAMGVDRVIAVNVGDLADREGVSYTILGLAGGTLDAMMRANTREGISSADVIVNVPLKAYGSLDWRRAPELIAEGYRAAESMSAQLSAFALSAADYAAWSQARQGRRRGALPPPAFVKLEGFGERDARRLNTLLPKYVGAPLEIAALELDLEQVTGLDRYETVNWRMVKDETGQTGLLVVARAKTYAPPFMMLGLNLENTTSSDFRITATARYLAYDVLTPGSELRVDGTLGSDPGVGFEFYQPIGPSPLFVAPYAGARTTAFNVIKDDVVVARYGESLTRLGLNLGANLGARSDLRVGAYMGRIDIDVKVGAAGLPTTSGTEKGAEAKWRYDGQDSPVIPRRGTFSDARLFYLFDHPDVDADGTLTPASLPVTQLSGRANRFWSLGERNRLFTTGGMGTSFDTDPLPTNKFSIGTPMRLGAYRSGELVGNHFYVATGGYLRRIGRLPDFLGGAVFAGAWLENGDAFDKWGDAKWRTNTGFGVIADTIVGPVMLSGSSGFDGRWRTYVGVGRIFR